MDVELLVSGAIGLLVGGLFAVEVGVGCGLLPCQFHFRLRTLLIGMTVVAVVLGFAAWAAGKPALFSA